MHSSGALGMTFDLESGCPQALCKVYHMQMLIRIKNNTMRRQMLPTQELQPQSFRILDIHQYIHLHASHHSGNPSDLTMRVIIPHLRPRLSSIQPVFGTLLDETILFSASFSHSSTLALLSD